MVEKTSDINCKDVYDQGEEILDSSFFCPAQEAEAEDYERYNVNPYHADILKCFSQFGKCENWLTVGWFFWSCYI